MASKTDVGKKVDVPPKGSRNPDPITNAPGSHPVETGVGAAIGGAASGAAVGAVAGPVGAVIGTAAGAVAGGYAGKGVGELIDPTTEDNWLRDNFSSRPYAKHGHTFESFHPAYRYGAEAEAKHQGRSFEDLETELERDWHHGKEKAAMAWHDAHEAVRDAYNRSGEIRRTRERSSRADRAIKTQGGRPRVGHSLRSLSRRGLPS
jgi:hypothetical protein